jgi:hypothetical protein
MIGSSEIGSEVPKTLENSRDEMNAPAGQLREWEKEFQAAACRPLKARWRYAFIRTHKPVLDDAPYRSFDTTAEYREWCEANLPRWLGYARAL